MSITSDDINFLIYRYLQESGFQHSAFIFQNECSLGQTTVKKQEHLQNVPRGALISFLQKGLQYLEIEQHISEGGTEINCSAPFSLTEPHICKIEENENMVDTEVNDDEVSTLEGHTSEVFICSWCPTSSLLASGSGDSTARIWKISEDLPSGDESSRFSMQNSVVLKHVNQTENSKDVTTLDWNHSGTLLATGSYDGLARIWDAKGNLKNTLIKHKGPIFSLKWNKNGDYLLSGSVDKTAIIWDPKTGGVKQQFEFHTKPTLDVDWKDNTSFATCSTDKMIYVCELGKTSYVKCFQGHQDEVNAIKWSPSGQYLASCSDDRTAKIWNMQNDRPIYDFSDHTKEIYTIKWSPTGLGSANPNKKLLLASASFDATIKLWDIEAGKCINTLKEHTDPVYSVSFSPNGEYLASGSFDRNLHIWSVKDGTLLKTFKGNGGIFEVCWNSKGNKIACSFSNNILCVLDFRM
eukprot:TRINITY_DN4905_c0_g1_i1.p2 TRINITY_DN4905_c0_g1~~TRINITY_DN4905_c0_g1_i1.p2  ORF type:complete len:465 (-),score=67.73 TRINITY_DN4905_c0_g1_i1:34-1428(-)